MERESFLADNQERKRKKSMTRKRKKRKRRRKKRRDKQIDEDLKKDDGNLGREIVGLNCGETLED